MKQVSPQASTAFAAETEFLSGVEANFQSARGTLFRGTIWQTQRADDGDRLRAVMAENRCYDRELLKSLPSNRRVILRGYDRLLLFWRRPTGAACATVLSPLDAYVTGRAPGPVGLADLVDHVRRVVGNSSVPHLVGVCSPTGFTDDVREGRLEIPNVTLVLVEPDGQGGWRITGGSDEVDPRVLRIFDPEGSKQKLERAEKAIRECSADLLTGSVSVAQVCKRSGLSANVVQQAFERLARRDPELRLTRQDGEVLLYRGAAPQRRERKSMDFIERIKSLFSGEAGDAEKLDALSERRAALSQRRDRMADDISALEQREADLLAAGKAATSMVVQKRMAAQLAQLRKDIRRQHTTLNMLNQQVNIISTDIHNLTLIQQGQMARLPSSEELTEHAVAAEEMLETLKSDAEMVGALEADQSELVTSQEELDILREFASEPAEAAKPAVASKTPERRTVRVTEESEAPSIEEETELPPPRAERQPPRRSAEPN